MTNRLLARCALLPAGWQTNVLLEWDDGGDLTSVTPNSQAGAATAVFGIVLPGVANVHSHAFQRAMAGLTEYRANPDDNFWSWRSLMYDFAQKLSPAAMVDVARQLYIEMLKAGYTSVCEFHYLHHDVGGKPYANPAELAECLIAAAASTGIGLTLLPVLYQYSSFGAQPAHAHQARFLNTPQWIMEVLERLQRTYPQHAGLRYGVAPHSLRAVSPQSLAELVSALNRWDGQAPIHMHIAEQIKEVDDCIACHGARPVEWLLNNVDVDQRWCLIHATHMTDTETQALASSGAVAGLCPTTEGNLGDGIFNGVMYAKAGGSWGIGSDSHISISLREELRHLEYSQRLVRRQRNVLVGPASDSVGAYLYQQATRGGAAAAGRSIAGLCVGQRADLVVLDDAHADLTGKQGNQWLDSFIFCNHAASPVRDVMVGGRWVVLGGRHAAEIESLNAYQKTLRSLLAK